MQTKLKYSSLVSPSTKALASILNLQRNLDAGILSVEATMSGLTLLIAVLDPDAIGILIGNIIIAQIELVELGHEVFVTNFKARDRGTITLGCNVRLIVREQTVGTNVDLLATSDLNVEVELAVAAAEERGAGA
jgi:hypothetical protein